MFKKFHSDKINGINGTENVLFFLSRAPSHHSFTFNLRFLFELNRKVRLSKTVCGFFHFRFRFFFIKVYIFVYSLTLKRHNSYNRKVEHSFAPRPLIPMLQ